jgi:hypothetical protein
VHVQVVDDLERPERLRQPVQLQQRGQCGA